MDTCRVMIAIGISLSEINISSWSFLASPLREYFSLMFGSVIGELGFGEIGEEEEERERQREQSGMGRK